VVSDSTTTADVDDATFDIEAQRAAVDEFLRGLLAAFGRSDATIGVTVVDDDTLEAAIDGNELGLLVGQKGTTLQSLQELVRSMVQRRFVGQAHARVRVDVAGYRERRRAALERFTADVAAGVRESGVAKALDPMGAADRKVVHDAVNEIDGVETVSEGEDANRHVVIRPVGS
jgi:spoIIIJ-associated protein